MFLKRLKTKINFLKLSLNEVLRQEAAFRLFRSIRDRRLKKADR